MNKIFISIYSFISLLFLACHMAFAFPNWDSGNVPTDKTYGLSKRYLVAHQLKTVTQNAGMDVLRIQTNFDEENESYTLTKYVIESSGTSALLIRSLHRPTLGSYMGMLKDIKGHEIAYASIGTGKEYRKLERAISLRFPLPKQDVLFELYAEHPTTGKMERVLAQMIFVAQLKKETLTESVEVKELALATKHPVIRVNIYSEGYLKEERETFWQHAQKAIQALQKVNFPGLSHMSFYGVYHPSNKKIGVPLDLGQPVPEYDSFLGLYYPYWDNFGHWDNVLYPTNEDKFRRGLATAPYDYLIVLTNNDGLWGVGNYMSHVAIPAANDSYFVFLLLHEFGHFFGLNEEYERVGSRTDLEFAPGIKEPWSQNITFFASIRDKLKWKKFVSPYIPLPTPISIWEPSPPVYGAYQGGYAGSPISDGRHSHKPGLDCAMGGGPHLCQICKEAILDVVQNSA